MAELTRPTGSTAGVSAEDLVAAVRVHADRVHDAVRRIGCDPDAAVQVVEQSAADLVDVVAARPETVEDAVGWWFARARALGRRVATRSAELPLGGGVLAVDEDQQILAEALEELPERERVALLLRDSYDLPASSVGAALGTSPDGAMEVVARARLAFLPLVDDEPAPPVPVHQTSVAALARIGEGDQVAARDATVRRHALSCEGCRNVTDGQQRAHQLLAGLTVVALPEAERDGVLRRIEEQAYAALPSSAARLFETDGEEEYWEEEDEEPRLFSPLLALLALVLAVLLGLGLGLLLSRTGGVGSLLGQSDQSGQDPTTVDLLTPPSQAPQELASPPVVQAPAPQTSVFVIPPPPPPPPPEPTAEPEPTAAQDTLGITVDPASGPNGATLTVNGRGWTPGTEVLVEYLDPTDTPTGSQAVVLVDARGRFTAELTAQDPNNLPGEHTVRAGDGTRGAEASYEAEV